VRLGSHAGVLRERSARVRARDGQDATSDLAKTLGELNLTGWPAPIYKFFLGKIAAESLLQEAKHIDYRKNQEQYCEAYFYLGQQALIQDDRNEAIRWFKATLDTKVAEFVEYRAALVELWRLNQ